MKLLLASVAVVAVGCGGGGGGEPIGGEMVVDWGTTHSVPDSGAAIEDPTAATGIMVGMADFGFDCGWASAQIHSGDTFVAFQLDESMQAVGDYTAFIAVTHADGNGIHSNAATGPLTITAFGERITGSLSMTTTDDDAGPVSASGTFDVLNCL